jgi:flagellar basal-body rod modification protein FlgD
MITPGVTFTQSPSTMPMNTSGKDYKMEFLNLMLTQMRNQDPTQPIDSSQMLAQQAQFASLEQMQNLNTNLSVLLAMQNVTQATNLLGKTVSGIDVNGGNIVGTVSGVSFADGMSMLKVDIGGGVFKDVKLPDVVEVGI